MRFHGRFSRRRSGCRTAWAPLFALVAALVCGSGADAQVRQLRVSQVHQVLDDEQVRVRAYLDLVGDPAGPAPGVAAGALTATLGEEPLTVERVEPMRGSGEGVAYIFLIDVSRSLSRAEFDRIVEEIENWIAGLARADRAAIIAFGERVRLVSDFTADREELAAALRSLGPTDQLTLLHRALVEALELAQRRDPGLPGRRALVVLTDGRDEGSGLTADDVLARLRSDPAPIYAIGFSRLGEPEERRRYLDLLLRLATNSGGVFFEADRAGFADAYRDVRDAVQRVWLADLLCTSCPADGREYRFQVTLNSNGRVVSDGQAVRIFPPRRPAATDPAPAPAEVPSEPAEPEPAAPAPPEEEPGPSPLRIVLLAAAALVGLLLLAILRRLLMGPRRHASEEPDGDELDRDLAEEDESEAEIAGQGIDAPLPPPLPTPAAPPPRVRQGPLRPLRLIVVRGSKPGREYRIILQDRAVVGRRSTCDCVLVGEPTVEPEQFELLQRGGRVYVQDLASGTPTLLDGYPVEDRTPIESGDLIGTGDLILRVVFD
ncbi:MAG: VWA domain-containing protein [Thermoanaerobaculia bacterium]|nr:VWA domain-containing protein [Thermoanaerobaculia bacterium]